MYNNRALVPDHMDYLQRWAKTSADVRASQPCVLDVAYGTGVRETLDIFPAARTAPGGVPVLVFIHGGTGARSTSPIIPSSRRRSRRRVFVWWW